jgi:four helix bundle protein
MHNYRELKIWQNSIELSEKIYSITLAFPNEEKFGLSSQLRRASVSVPSNIAEGTSRKSDKEFNHFLSISLGSLFEIETQLTIASRVGYLSEIELEKLNSTVKQLIKMIMSFRKSVLV